MNLRLTISTIGAIIGIAGLEHGIGEMLQDDVAPDGFYIKSWPNSRLYEIVDGEPAITIVPNLFLAGLVTILLSILFIAWIVFFLQSSYQKYNFYILLLFSISLLLSGGGVAPPVIGFIVCFFIGRLKDSDQNIHKTIYIHDKTAKLWSFFYVLFVLAFLSLWPGLIILSLFLELSDPLVVYFLVFTAFTSLILALYIATLLEPKLEKEGWLKI